jgi:hypothetical protein
MSGRFMLGHAMLALRGHMLTNVEVVVMSYPRTLCMSEPGLSEVVRYDTVLYGMRDNRDNYQIALEIGMIRAQMERAVNQAHTWQGEVRVSRRGIRKPRRLHACRREGGAERVEPRDYNGVLRYV